jgi:hypothetical protein
MAPEKGSIFGVKGDDSASFVISSAVLGLLSLWRIALGLRFPPVTNERKARVVRGDFARGRRGRTDALAIVKAATLVML